MTRWLAILMYFSFMTRLSGGSTIPRLPVPYPESFSITFHTNITTKVDDNINNTTTNYPVTGKLYYDWTRQRQRIDHAPGSYECQHFYHTHHACSLLFIENKGMYRITHSSSANGRPCCLDLAHVGVPPPDWAALAKPTFNGVVHDAYSGRSAFQWTFDHLDPSPFHYDSSRGGYSISNYHTVRQVATRDDDDDKFAPLVFTFPGKADGRQDFHYQIETLVIGPQDPSMFQIPDGCESIVCDKATTRQSIS